MKANKALKRLTKIEALMSKVRDQYSASAPNLENVLQQATAAIARAKEAVSLQASSGTKAASAKVDRAAKKAALPEKKAAVKKAAKKTAPAPVVQAATKAAGQ
ncbi:MAG TPA: hypothetical protein VFC39_14840 [Acidobacteriaceae bacterium]|nr:hypothetical protein [Acidobacteriaceae bacterium]